MFKRFNLRITTEINVKKTDFLDAVLDLNNGTTAPYKKPLDQPIYVNKDSSHPPKVLSGIQASVQDRLSKLSSSKQEFDKAKPTYEEALKKAGYSGKLEFARQQVATQRKNRRRKVNWFTPPFSVAVQGSLTNSTISLGGHFHRTILI